jgi:hypothetical protein
MPRLDLIWLPTLWTSLRTTLRFGVIQFAVLGIAGHSGAFATL